MREKRQPENAISEETRRQLANFARSSRTRVNEFTRDRPCDWRPMQTINPESSEVFTEPGAWEFVAERLEAQTPVEIIILDKPPGRRAYVMHVQTDSGSIYVKLELGHGKVIGRSFHISDYQRPHKNKTGVSK